MNKQAYILELQRKIDILRSAATLCKDGRFNSIIKILREELEELCTTTTEEAG